MFEKLRLVELRFLEMEERAAQPDFYQDPKAASRLLREKKPDTKVVVGGAVMTQEYADKIGADAYSKDAMGSVRYVESLT